VVALGLAPTGHVAALNLALVKRTRSAVVDLVLVLGLTQYLVVPVPRGSGKHPIAALLPIGRVTKGGRVRNQVVST
jgi:hypothetical protein